MPTRARSATRTKIPPLAQLVDSATAVNLTGFTLRHLYRLTAEGKLPVYKIGSRNRYWVDDLQSLVSRRGAA